MARRLEASKSPVVYGPALKVPLAGADGGTAMMAGNSIEAGRSVIIALAVAAAAIVAGAAGGVGPASAGDAASQRPGGDPPSTAELRRATKRFLAGQGSGEASSASSTPAAAAAAGGSIFPRKRVVAFYGAPQLTQTIIGRHPPAKAGRKLRRQAARYRGPDRRPVIREIDLIGVIATADAGADRKYRMRQSPQVIRAYLSEARRIGARLMLDIQPGRSGVLDELRALRRWVVKRDVDVAIDPEWNVGRRGIPGKTRGKITARTLNRFSARLQRIVARRGLPPKILAVHQFHRGSVRRRGKVRQRRDVEVTLNFDGIGSPAAKRAGYASLAAKRLHNGFSLFYLRDDPLMTPGAVMRVRPEPDFVLYQ